MDHCSTQFFKGYTRRSSFEGSNAFWGSLLKIITKAVIKSAVEEFAKALILYKLLESLLYSDVQFWEVC